jgi:hypothetical protein
LSEFKVQEREGMGEEGQHVRETMEKWSKHNVEIADGGINQ